MCLHVIVNIWGFEMTSLPVKKVYSFSALVKQSGKKWELQLPSVMRQRMMGAHRTMDCRSHIRAKVAKAVKFVTLWMRVLNLTFGSILVSLFTEMRKEKETEEKVMDRYKVQSVLNKHGLHINITINIIPRHYPTVSFSYWYIPA